MDNINKDDLINALLKYNYLPTQKKDKSELPPIFSTEGIEIDLLKNKKNTYSSDKCLLHYDDISYSVSRFNNVNRIFSIPHPLPYINAVKIISEYWENNLKVNNKEFDSIKHILTSSKNQYKPKKYNDDFRLFIMNYDDENDDNESNPKQLEKDLRLFIMENSPSEKSKIHLNLSLFKKYKVNADISNCFPSIYTHSISWAIFGVEESKKNIKDKNFNLLDKAISSMKRNETNGIGIGAGVSNIISDIILTKVDENLKKYNFTRYIDDYICYCYTEEEAENFILDLANELSIYKLKLNSKKTKIEKLPLAINSEWIIEINNYMQFEKLTYKNILNALDFAVICAKKYPEGSVLKYTLKTILSKLKNKSKDIDNLRILVLNYTINLSYYNPILMNYIYLILLELTQQNQNMDSKDFIHVFNNIEKLVEHHAKFKRSDAVCWGLYLLYQYNHKLFQSDTLSKAVIDTEDCLSITLLSLFKNGEQDTIEFSKQLIKNANELLMLENFEQAKYMIDQNWLLLYELFFRNKIINPYIIFNKKTNANKNECQKCLNTNGKCLDLKFFDKMKTKQISFMNIN